MDAAGEETDVADKREMQLQQDVVTFTDCRGSRIFQYSIE